MTLNHILAGLNFLKDFFRFLLRNIFLKGQIMTISDFAGQMVSATAIQLFSNR